MIPAFSYAACLWFVACCLHAACVLYLATLPPIQYSWNIVLFGFIIVLVMLFMCCLLLCVVIVVSLPFYRRAYNRCSRNWLYAAAKLRRQSKSRQIQVDDNNKFIKCVISTLGTLYLQWAHMYPMHINDCWYYIYINHDRILTMATTWPYWKKFGVINKKYIIKQKSLKFTALYLTYLNCYKNKTFFNKTMYNNNKHNVINGNIQMWFM